MSLEQTLSDLSYNERSITLLPGALIADRYEVIRHLGTGGSSEVYLCSDREQPDRPKIAVKLMSRQEEDLFGKGVHEVSVARFLDEVKISRILTHPNIIAVHELIRSLDSLAFCMEYIEGDNLADVLQADTPLTLSQAVHIIHQTVSAVQFMHSLGIIHRDLKPENLLISRNGSVKVIDFGTARMEGSLGIQGEIAGTLSYLSPEYLRDGILDYRSDIYALGMMAYETITGQLPFTGGGVIETLQLRLTVDPPPLYEKKPDCPVALSNIIIKALEREPDYRHQSAQDLLTDLTSFMGSEFGGATCPLILPFNEVSPTLEESTDNEIQSSSQANLMQRMRQSLKIILNR